MEPVKTPKAQKGRFAVESIIDLLGCAALVYGIALVYKPAAFIAAGLLLLLSSFAVARRSS
jgi:hypothetical protein